jgi:hypothetical protein
MKAVFSMFSKAVFLGAKFVFVKAILVMSLVAENGFLEG